MSTGPRVTVTVEPTINYGDQPTAVCRFYDATGALVTPSPCTVIRRTPAGVETTSTAPTDIATTSTGVMTYTSPAAFTAAGAWLLRVKGTVGGLTVAREVPIVVQATAYTAP